MIQMNQANKRELPETRENAIGRVAILDLIDWKSGVSSQH